MALRVRDILISGFSGNWDTCLFYLYMVLSGSVMAVVGVYFSIEMYYKTEHEHAWT